MIDAHDPLAGLTPEQKRARLAELLKEKARQQKAVYPPSDGQRALWYIHRLNPESSAYHVAFSVRVRSAVDLVVLRRAAQSVIDRHAALRTTYSVQESNLVQVVHGYQEVDFAQLDASGWDDEMLYRQVLQSYAQPFDLQSGPVTRWRLFSRGPADHVLLLCVHHIAIDAWSLWLVFEDLRKALTGQALPPQERQYADWAHWQAEMLAGPEGMAHQAFWQQQLAGELPLLNLPIDFARPPVQTYHGDSLSFTIPAGQTQRIKALAQAEDVTLYMLLLAVYQVLLYRYSGQDEILVGTPTSGRNQPDFHGVVGYFVNPVTLRGRLDGNPTFKDFLARVRQTVIDALAHQDFPFIRVVERLNLRQDPARSPVFQCLFNLHKVQRVRAIADLVTANRPNARVDFGGLAFEPYFFPQEEGQFELTLEVIDAEETLLCTLRYHTDLFQRATAERLKRSFETLLDGLLAAPETPIADVPVLPANERRTLLVDWNQTQADYPRQWCIQQLFEDQATRTPQSVAVVSGEQSWTYAELNQRANQLAHHLRSLGVGPNQMVGVFLERSAEMAAAVLGVLKSGGAYVPMDPMFPPQRIAYMIEDAQMPVIITQRALADALPSHTAQIVWVDDDQPRLARQPGENPALVGSAEDLAYVIFTSGSTGRPKGVQIPHRAVVNFLLSVQRQPGMNPADVLASVTTLSFDIAGLELYLPLISGARVVVLSADTAADGAALAEALDRCAATVMQATPATWRLLVETGWAGRPGLKMLCGGEALPQPLARQLLEKGGELWNLYGPTETTIWSTLQRIGPEDEPITIGRPIANTEIYILDEHLQPVPIGVVGGLYIGGDGLARGYLNRPDLTDEKFIPHPFNRQPGARLYQTGDLARYLPDGRVECLGRSDSQVKLRGFRIELGEIEAVLGEHSDVRQAVVMMRSDPSGEARLAAYLTPQPGRSPTGRELRGFLREKLPPYMIPAAYVLLEAFPLTPNGKVDRRALPAPTQGGAEAQKTTQPPQTPMEKLIAESWQKALGVAQVGLYDNFFDLGGHSLLAMQVVDDLQARTGSRLNPAYLRFESLGQLAVTLGELVNSDQSAVNSGQLTVAG